MKRLFGLSLVGIFLLGLSASHFVMADHNDGHSGLTTVCHITNSFVRPNGNVSFIGTIKLVVPAEQSLQAHLAHGDILADGEDGDCCAFCLTLTGRSCGID